MKTEPQPDPVYDKEEVYEDQIVPLIRQLNEICTEHEIPALCAFVFASDGRQIKIAGLSTNKENWVPLKLLLAEALLRRTGVHIEPLDLKHVVQDVLSEIAEGEYHSKN